MTALPPKGGRAVTECPVTIPASWDEETTRFHFNQGTWCATNILGDLERLAEQNDGCLCPFTTIEVVGFDADQQEELRLYFEGASPEELDTRKAGGK